MKKTIITVSFVISATWILLAIFNFYDNSPVIAQTKEVSEIPNLPVKQNVESMIEPTRVIQLPSKAVKPNSVVPSNLLAELERRQIENPRLSNAELAEIGTRLIREIGFDYNIDLSILSEKAVKPANRKKTVTASNEQNYYTVSLALPLANGQNKTFEFFAPEDESCCCGYYYSPIPVSKISDKTMTIIVGGKPYEIKRTKELGVSPENILTDRETRRKTIRKWQVPDEERPYGISRDGKYLYIELGVSDLLLEISESGDLKIVTKNAENIISGGIDLNQREDPKVGEILYKSGENGLMNFKSGDQSYLVDFPYVCT